MRAKEGGREGRAEGRGSTRGKRGYHTDSVNALKIIFTSQRTGSVRGKRGPDIGVNT